ncbi:hypothetical protein [Shinella zoogloeoides]|uniref:hypothetical protein n=1 Tax=Shinella zoogloeoides TaxID=352475 RepID=UPI00299CFD33|nr:hypothetical protein [Shinella zoogloeoides]WPE19908.1 hypothetical protein ShzoTeo12_10840 [Shinella zoogloeoides]
MAEFYNGQAITEGWAIFECDGSENGPFQAMKDDDQDVFATDDEVFVHIVARAAEGSEYHLKALEFLRVHNPIEHAAITQGKAAAMKAREDYWAARKED